MNQQPNSFTEALQQAGAGGVVAQQSQPSLPDFLPYYDRLLVRRLDPDHDSAAHGYSLPDAAKQVKGTWAEVVAVGGGQLLESGLLSSMISQVGDKVALGKYAGTDIKLDGKDYVVLRESEVLGRVERTAVGHHG